MIFIKRLLILVFLFSGAAQAAVLEITFSPTTKTVLPGESFSMDIWGSLPSSGVANIDAGGLLLTFDNGVINLDSLVYGAPFIDLLTSIDNTTGSAEMAFGNFGTVSDPMSFQIATLFMTAGNPPSSPFTLLDLSVDPFNPFIYDFVNEIASTDIAVTDGIVNVNAVPLPASAWLMLSGIAMLGFRLRSFGREENNKITITSNTHG